MPAQSFRMQTEQRSVRAQEGGLRTSLSFLELVASAATLVNADRTVRNVCLTRMQRALICIIMDR